MKKIAANDLKKFIPPDGTVLEIRKEGRYIKAFDANGVDLSGWISSNTRKSAFNKNKNLKVKMVGGHSTGWTWRQVSKETKVTKVNFENIKKKVDVWDLKSWDWNLKNIVGFAWLVILFIFIFNYQQSSKKKYTSTELNTMLKDKTRSDVISIIGKPTRGGEIWSYRKLAWDEYSEKYQDCFVHFYPYNCSDPACWVDEVRCY